MKAKILCVFVGILIVLSSGIVLAQSSSQAVALIKEANTIFDSAKSKDDYLRAAQKYEDALKIFEKMTLDEGAGFCSSQLGVIHFRLGQHQKALEYYKKSLAISQKVGDVKGGGTTLQSIGQVYYSLSQYAKALEYYEKVLAISKKVGDVKGEGVTLDNIGQLYNSLGQYQKALEYYEKSLAISQKVGDVKGGGITLHNIGQVYYSLCQHQKALEYYEKSLAISQKVGDVKGEGVALNNIAGIYHSWGQYQKALEYYEKSLAISQKVGDVNGGGTTLHNIGRVYYSLCQYQKALEYYEKSLAISQTVGDVKGEGVTLDNIAGVYESWGQYAKALEYYEKSLAVMQKVGDVNRERITLHNIGLFYYSLCQYAKALEYYEKSLAIGQKVGDVKGGGATILGIGSVYKSWGHYAKALTNYEKSLAISQKIGDVKGEGVALNNIGMVYESWGQYQKALEYYEKSLAISQKVGDVGGGGTTLANIGGVCKSYGQYAKALGYYEKSLAIMQKVGDVKAGGDILWNIADTFFQMGKYDQGLKAANESLVIQEKIGVPVEGIKNSIANYYLDAGDTVKAEPLISETKFNSTLGRLALIKSDYPSAQRYYEIDVKWAEKTRNSDSLFRSYTGLGRAYEGMKNYPKAEEYYEKAVNQVEDIRSGILPAERKNFFEVKTTGFARSDPAKGLARVRIKLNHPDASVAPSELTKARSFADHLSQANSIGATNIPSSLIEKEQSYVNQLAAMKKELAKTDAEKAPDKFNNLSKSVREAKNELDSFVKKLWKDYPAYAAVKYPRPPSLKDSALRPDECAVIFDVSGEGVGVILVRDKAVSKAFYLDLKLTDLERDVTRFREPFEKLHLKDYDPELAKSLYDKLLRPVLVDVPKGAPLTIIPDGILAMLPFEALVTGGEATWNKSEKGLDYPQGLTFLGDERPISYYQSITALTLARTIGNREKPKDSLLVVADPVFNMKDRRAQQASETRLSQKEKEYNIQRMAAMEDDLGPLFPQLPETGKLAANLSSMYGSNCLAITGLKADKLDFLSKIAPRMDQYGKVVFATHGVMGNKVPGVMEPFLALSMVPPGTDGFLKMSDILSLKMNSDIVALTACQTGLGKELSGEGVMSMGRAFQYAGAKSVLMTLWEVADTSSVKLTESFFQHRKSGKSKLESLKLARDEIRKQGFEHPFFWSAFILVGEVN